MNNRHVRGFGCHRFGSRIVNIQHLLQMLRAKTRVNRQRHDHIAITVVGRRHVGAQGRAL